ncbi:Pkinase-domain-containing protein [Scheffersomyces coipomensis]|uniref:Pkinase-domain-containing protein n=1 Tax=Scheffersomyces coipomensis TaxID=1788519 RepID=UPI00315D2E1F
MFNIPERGGRPQNLRIQIPSPPQEHNTRAPPPLQLQINPKKDRKPPDLSLYTQQAAITTTTNTTVHPRDLPLETLGSSGLESLALNKEIYDVGSLGAGAGGWVSKCEIRPNDPNLPKKIFAIKTLPPGPRDIELKELIINERCNSPYIVKYYGTFRHEGNICIAMEYMDAKSLHEVYNRVKSEGAFLHERVLSEIARSILLGLKYLNAQRILHRDIKPSNILFNLNGAIKLCDLGISRDLDGTLASTFVGTRNYMAPERLSGEKYGVNCETWSVGITILEAAIGEHPLPEHDEFVANYDKLAPPQLTDLPDYGVMWSPAFKDFINQCLKVNVNVRPSPTQMLEHPWIKNQQDKPIDMGAFIRRVWQ